MIEPITFAHKLLAPPMDFHFGLRSGGSIFGAGRPSDYRDLKEGDEFYECHTGIDLYPKGLQHKHSIYAADWGTVESVEDMKDPSDADDPVDWEILIRHRPHSSGVYTLYRHLHSVEPQIQPNAEVNVGEVLGRIDDLKDEPHLHFMWALKTDPADPFIEWVNVPGGGKRRIFNCIPLDPTPLLYRFEAFRWPSVSGKLPRCYLRTHSKIRQIRVTHWFRSPAATWLLEVEMAKESNPEESDYFYLPISDALPHEKLMADIIRDSFHNGNRVRLSWHDSYFYGERKMIDDVRVRP
jgi:hypothetical protein